MVHASAIVAALAPPYDLIKIDVEGAENAFIRHYEPLLSSAAYLMLEWHSWDDREDNERSVRKSLEDAGYTFLSVLSPRRSLVIDGKPLSAGTHLYRRR